MGIKLAHDAIRVDSMHWNRTLHASVLERLPSDGSREVPALSEEVIAKVRQAIQEEISKTEKDLQVVDVKVTAELAPKRGDEVQ